MINLMYVLPNHYLAKSFPDSAVADGACKDFVANVARTQTEYHSIVIVNDFLFTTFRTAIARGEIAVENIRLIVASGDSEETVKEERCTFSVYGVPLAEDGRKYPSFAGTDPLEDLLRAVGDRRCIERQKV
jgi:hypothetical protein